MAVNLEAIRKRMEELQKNRRNSNVQLWKPKEAGEYLIRGLPWPEKLLQPGQPLVEQWFYYIGKNFGTLTPHQFGKPDPIKDFIDSLYKSGKPEDREIAKKLRPKMQAYMPIVVKKGKDADPTKPIVWSINKFLYQQILGWFLDPDIGDYLDPETGIDIKVTVIDEGKTFNGKKVFKSTIELARKSSKLADTPEAMKALLDAVPDISEMNELKSPDELKKMLEDWLNGGASDGGGDDGADRGQSSNDALEELANDIKAKPAEKAEVKDEKKKSKETKPKKVDDESPKQSLDDAFNELMSDETN